MWRGSVRRKWVGAFVHALERRPQLGLEHESVVSVNAAQDVPCVLKTLHLCKVNRFIRS